MTIDNFSLSRKKVGKKRKNKIKSCLNDESFRSFEMKNVSSSGLENNKELKMTSNDVSRSQNHFKVMIFLK